MKPVIIPYRESAIKLPHKKRPTKLYSPMIPLVVTCGGHTTQVSCLLDSGADMNVFPLEVALHAMGIKRKYLERKGVHYRTRGIGGSEFSLYGLPCSFHHPRFRVGKEMIFFLENQTQCLLGRVGFMNAFTHITFNEEDKQLELIKE